MKKLAIIGASYLQLPLIEKAKSMGIETHVFAWAANDVGEKSADYFYPISIIEKEQILAKCREIGINGICSIASDLAMLTVNYVAEQLGLIGNSMNCTLRSTNKHQMRLTFEQNGDPSPRSLFVEGEEDLCDVELCYPVVVKPTDRSGSRGITKLDGPEGLAEAIAYAKTQGFEKKVLVEEFVTGQEYSVECISWKGQHHFLAMTKKYTTGAPRFIETGHMEPACITGEKMEQVRQIVFHALNSLQIQNGASHTELKINDAGQVKIIEIGGRMGGDCIGSDLVALSTGIDFVQAVINVALGVKPELQRQFEAKPAAIRFVFAQNDLDILNQLKQEHLEYLLREDVRIPSGATVVDSSTRYGYFLMCGPDQAVLEDYMPRLET